MFNSYFDITRGYLQFRCFKSLFGNSKPACTVMLDPIHWPATVPDSPSLSSASQHQMEADLFVFFHTKLRSSYYSLNLRSVPIPNKQLRCEELHGFLILTSRRLTIKPKRVSDSGKAFIGKSLPSVQQASCLSLSKLVVSKTF